MLVKILFTAFTLLSAVTALPTDPNESHRILKRLGIDPTGPIPSDAVLQPSGGYEFAADSPASHWARVQTNTEPPTSMTLGKRGSPNLSMTMWQGGGCTGSGLYFANVQYHLQYFASNNYWYNSLQWGRPLLDQEQLDISTEDNKNLSDWCGVFMRSAPKRQSGCYHPPSFTCFNLWHY